MSDPQIISDIHATYLSLIVNSVHSPMFRHMYAMVYGEYQDVMRGGELSCAYFVSFILTGFGLIKKTHATVSSTVKDLEESSWYPIPIDDVGAGDVIVWDEIVFGNEKHMHIGFAVSSTEAVSNNAELKTPQKHPIYHEINGVLRPIAAVYRSKKVHSTSLVQLSQVPE